MEKKKIIVVLITAKDAGEAEKISKTLVEGRLAACANIIPEASSRFRWQDKLETAKETLLIVKTQESRLPELVKSVKKIHSYSVPEIIALPISGGNQEYLDWVGKETFQD